MLNLHVPQQVVNIPYLHLYPCPTLTLFWNKSDLREILSGTDIYIYLNNLESESKEMSSEPL